MTSWNRPKTLSPPLLSLWVSPFAQQRNVMTWVTGWGFVSSTEDTADTEELRPFEDLDRYRHSGAGHMTVKLAADADQRHWQVCRASAAPVAAARNSLYIPGSNMLMIFCFIMELLIWEKYCLKALKWIKKGKLLVHVIAETLQPDQGKRLIKLSAWDLQLMRFFFL